MPLLETISVPLKRALQLANSQQANYAGFGPQAASPFGAGATDGVIEMGAGGMIAPNRVKLIPFGTSQPGQQFTMRLYAWDYIGPPDANAANIVWIPKFLAEFYCILGNLPGPGSPPPGNPMYLESFEYLCDSMTLTNGAVGPWYSGVNSVGAGSGLVAWGLVDVVGSKYLQFDFSRAADDNVSADSFNCLWSRA